MDEDSRRLNIKAIRFSTIDKKYKSYNKEKTGWSNGDNEIYFGSSTNSPSADDLIAVSDFALMHGNDKTTQDMQQMIDYVRSREPYKSSPKPIV